MGCNATPLQVFGAGDAQFQVAAAGIFDQRVGGQDTAVVNVGITAEGKFKQLSDAVTVGVGGIQRSIAAEIVSKASSPRNWFGRQLVIVGCDLRSGPLQSLRFEES